MYRVSIRQSWDGDEVVIHSAQANGIKLVDGKVQLDVSAIDTFSFSIYPNNAGYNQLDYLKTLIRVYDTRKHRNVFEGRILEPNEILGDDGDLHKEAIAEDFLAFLHDSISDFMEFTKYTKSQIFRALIEMHNRMAEPYKQFKIGKVEFADDSPIDYAYSDDSKTTYDNLVDLLITPHGGELQVRHEADGLWIDVAPKIGQKGNQRIELTKNLLSLSRTIDPTQIITVLKPLGKQLDDSAGGDKNDSGYFDIDGYWHEGQSSSSSGYFDQSGYWHESQENPGKNSDSDVQKGTPKLTITSVNNGSPFLRDEAKIALYGVQIKSHTFDDISDAAKLRDAGLAWMKTPEAEAVISYQLSAIDLSLIDIDIDDLRCGWVYSTKVPVTGLNTDLRIVQQTIDIIDLSQTTITIGDRVMGTEESNGIANLTEIRQQLNGQSSMLAAHSSEIQKLADGTPIINTTPVPDQADLNTVTVPGMYAIAGAVTHGPLESFWGTLLVMAVGNKAYTQTITISQTGDVYVRVTSQTGQWQNWRQQQFI